MKIPLKILPGIILVAALGAGGAWVAREPIAQGICTHFAGVYDAQMNREFCITVMAARLADAAICDALPAEADAGMPQKSATKAECLTRVALSRNDPEICAGITDTRHAPTKIDCLLRVASTHKNIAACDALGDAWQSRNGIRISARLCRILVENPHAASGALLQFPQDLCNTDADCPGTCLGNRAIPRTCDDGRCSVTASGSVRCETRDTGWTCDVLNGVAACRKPAKEDQPLCNTAEDCPGRCQGNSAVTARCAGGRCVTAKIVSCAVKQAGWTCSVYEGIAACRRPAEGKQQECNKSSDCPSTCQDADLALVRICRDGRCEVDPEASQRCSRVKEGYGCAVLDGVAACRRPKKYALEECNDTTDCTTSCLDEQTLLRKACSDGRCQTLEAASHCDRYGTEWTCSVVNKVAACRRPQEDAVSAQLCNTSEECKPACEGEELLLRKKCQDGRC
ncbi:MAG: hypothetical protein PHI23_04665, partial [Candidatus Peribacteraceae bacterium]|nr:hypothetical protein [Candidatus Peribacteraceae bacterium]